jgi:hypothetical protein
MEGGKSLGNVCYRKRVYFCLSVGRIRELERACIHEIYTEKDVWKVGFRRGGMLAGKNLFLIMPTFIRN